MSYEDRRSEGPYPMSPAGCSGALLSKLRELLERGFAPTAEHSPVRATVPYSIDGFGVFRVREHEGFEAMSMETGHPVSVPGSGGNGALDTKLMEVRGLLLSGQPAVPFPGVGVFEVKTQAKPMGIKHLVSLKLSSEFKAALQTLSEPGAR